MNSLSVYVSATLSDGACFVELAMADDIISEVAMADGIDTELGSAIVDGKMDQITAVAMRSDLLIPKCYNYYYAAYLRTGSSVNFCSMPVCVTFA